MSEKIKAVIVGPGAIGCLFAGYLAKSGNQVWLLDKNKQRARQLSQDGVRIEEPSGTWQAKVNASTDPKEIGKSDLVIIAVKSYDTQAASKSIKPLVDANSSVMTLQNGLGNVEIIAEAINQEQIVAGVTSQGATLLGIGSVRHAGSGETVIGRIDGRMLQGLRRIREVFNSADLETRISRDIKGIIWSKLIINVGINALTCITRLNNGRLTQFSGTAHILREAVLEAVKVAKRKRIKLIYDDPLAKVEGVCEATAANVSSMLQDVLKKRRTEIDFINGVIVRQAKSLGITCPVNSLLVDLVKTIESTYSIQVF